LCPLPKYIFIQTEVHEEVYAGGKQNARHDCGRGHSHKEPPVVGSANAIVQPHAMVVKDIDTLVACPAVLAPDSHCDVTYGAVRQFLILLAPQILLVRISNPWVHRVAACRIRGSHNEDTNADHITNRHKNKANSRLNQRQPHEGIREHIQRKDAPA